MTATQPLSIWPNRDPIGELGFEILIDRPTRSVTVDEYDSEDPLASDGPNLYLFVRNRPTSEVDPLGLLLGFGHGNWCGYKRYGQTGGGKTVDQVDAACKKHDDCLKDWAQVCKFKFCNVRFCKDVAKAKCHRDKACKKAKRTILAGCFLIVPIPPFIHM